MIVAPGQSAVLTGTTLDARPELAATVIEKRIVPFVLQWYSPPHYVAAMGELQDTVGRSHATETLDFHTRISLHTDDFALIRAVRETFATVVGTGVIPKELDIDYRLDGPGEVGPKEVIVSNSWVLFEFMENLEAELHYSVTSERSSYDMFIRTPAQDYDSNGQIELFGKSELDYASSVPFSHIPTFQPILVAE